MNLPVSHERFLQELVLARSKECKEVVSNLHSVPCDGVRRLPQISLCRLDELACSNAAVRGFTQPTNQELSGPGESSCECCERPSSRHTVLSCHAASRAVASVGLSRCHERGTRILVDQIAIPLRQMISEVRRLLFLLKRNPFLLVKRQRRSDMRASIPSCLCWDWCC